MSVSLSNRGYTEHLELLTFDPAPSADTAMTKICNDLLQSLTAVASCVADPPKQDPQNFGPAQPNSNHSSYDHHVEKVERKPKALGRPLSGIMPAQKDPPREEPPTGNHSDAPASVTPEGNNSDVKTPGLPNQLSVVREGSSERLPSASSDGIQQLPIHIQARENEQRIKEEQRLEGTSEGFQLRSRASRESLVSSDSSSPPSSARAASKPKARPRFIPGLKLGGVGPGTWMGGESTAGEVYNA
eukprot:GHVN01003199.1.p1 GENE.GHVN01003199.1~~GHVN01003199.1.p1  ORF type:complete len:244 (-),score=27.80 GHVN01003199.1:48-779(-)